jgi:tetratricopeptide (TPR) repeat protein
MQDFKTQLQGLVSSYPKVLKKEQDRAVVDATMNALNASITPERRRQCETLLNEGMRLYQLDRNDEAYEKFEQSKAVYANGDAWHHQGVINFQKQNFGRAFEEFSAAIMLYKDYASAYRFRALCVLFLLEENNNLNQTSELKDFARANLNKAISLGDAEAKRALAEFFKLG